MVRRDDADGPARAPTESCCASPTG